MIRQNLHTHTFFDDGKNTPAEMAEAAVAAGLTSLGFSAHSTLPWENDWTLQKNSVAAYLTAVRDIKQRFAGRLTVFSGIEWDTFSDQDPAGFDYVIGSVHSLRVESGIVSVDESPTVTKMLLDRSFGGDADALAEEFFAQYEIVAEAPFVDIVGHFDLLTKYDEKHFLFDGTSSRYLDAAVAAMELLLRADKLFEVNTGAISRGWRTSPYPSRKLLQELKARDARLVVSADAHSSDAITCAFPETEELLRSLGFRERWELTERGFSPIKL